MYVWRGKNRRDRRNFLVSGIRGWFNFDSDLKSEIAEDIVLREEREEHHVKYFFDIVRVTIHEFLKSEWGLEEIELVIKEIEKNDAKKQEARLKGEISEEEANVHRKKTIYEIFRKYDADGSNSIDAVEMKILLKELGIPMTDEQFDELFKSLDSDGGGEIDFEEFYNWFQGEAERKKNRSRWEKAKDVVFGGFYDNFQRLVLETEARNALLDYCVKRTVDNARKEFRIAHPPTFLCEKCNQSFLNKDDLYKHSKDKEFHLQFDDKVQDEIRRFGFVQHIFVGTQGRRLLANRLLFSPELAMSDSRVNAARLEPFRPMLNDPTQKRRLQMEAGMVVQGFNPSTGTRPQYRHLNLIKQYRAPGKRNDQPFLEDLLMELVHCRDDSVDIVTVDETGAHADVRFMWTGYASNTIQIIGEFNGWKPEDLFPDARIGKCYIRKLLCPGRYRYRFVIDGKEVVDPSASKIEDKQFGLCNIVAVINPLINRTIGPNVIQDNEGSSTPSKGHMMISSRSEGSLMSEVSSDSRDKITSENSNNKNNNNKTLVVKQNNNTGKFSDPKSSTQSQELLSRLRQVNLRNMSLADDGAWALAGFIQRNNVIESLDISFNGISDDGMMAITKCLPELPRLATLKLSGNGFGFETSIYLLKSLRQSKSILRLELSSNNLGDDGAETISELVTRHVSLRELFLDSCHISDHGTDFIATSLTVNSSLTYLSLASNHITKKSALLLSTALRQNASLLDINISYNSFGPEGGKYFGDMLYENFTLKTLDLSKTELGKDGSFMGLHAICYSLDRNRTLSSLKIAYNLLNNEHIRELAHKLMTNRGLLHVDLTGNQITSQWMMPETYLETREIERLPTIQTSLDYNRKVLDNPETGDKYVTPIPEMENTADGYWTVRRRWKKVNRKSEEKKAKRLLSSEESAKIKLEREFVEEEVQGQVTTVKTYLDDPQSLPFIQIIAKLIGEHYNNLSKLTSMEMTTDVEQSLQDNVKEQKARTGVNDDIIDYFDESFDQMHVAIMSVLFKELQCNRNSMFLHPEQLEALFQYLCLPMRPEDMQPAVDATLVPDSSGIGFKRCCNYTKQIAKEISKKNKFQRLRLLADCYFHPPIHEAKQLILDNIAYISRIEATKHYRMLPGKMPRFICYYCGKQFTTDKSYQRHRSKGDDAWEHKRFHMHLTIFHAQRAVLRKAKYLYTKTYYPSYLELVPEQKLPRDYSPQVFDKMGREGRPIGVIDANRAIRVEDVLGDFVQIAFEGRLGWTRFRFLGHTILQPACTGVSNFSWDHLVTYDTPRYYRVKDDIPKRIELKVRYMPMIQGDVCGYLKPGDVVLCRGVLGDWLQIRFNNEDCAWVIRVSHGGDHSVNKTQFEKPKLLNEKARKKVLIDEEEEERKRKNDKGPKIIIDKLAIGLQRKFTHRIGKVSPFTPTEDDLKMEDEWSLMEVESGGAMHHGEDNEDIHGEQQHMEQTMETAHIVTNKLSKVRVYKEIHLQWHKHHKGKHGHFHQGPKITMDDDDDDDDHLYEDPTEHWSAPYLK